MTYPEASAIFYLYYGKLKALREVAQTSRDVPNPHSPCCNRYSFGVNPVERLNALPKLVCSA